MSWWLHLLLRREKSLRERVDVFERIFRAVGRMRYVERCEPLMLFRSCQYQCIYKEIAARVLLQTVNQVSHSYADEPARLIVRPKHVSVCISFAWMHRGRFARRGAKPYLVDYNNTGLLWVHTWGSGEVRGAESPDLHWVIQ